MIQLGTLLKVADKTGVVLGQCIKVLGNGCKRIASIGDMILISVK
jgi:large subunit ribosomal protein L14